MSRSVFVYTFVCPTDLKGGNCYHNEVSSLVPLELGHEVSLGVDSTCTGRVTLYVADYVIKRIVHRVGNLGMFSGSVTDTLVFIEMEKATIEKLLAAGAKEDARVVPKGFSPNIKLDDKN